MPSHGAPRQTAALSGAKPCNPKPSTTRVERSEHGTSQRTEALQLQGLAHVTLAVATGVRYARVLRLQSTHWISVLKIVPPLRHVCEI